MKNANYLSKSKSQTLQVFWAVIGGGIGGRTFGDLARELQINEGSLLKELNNLAVMRYIERRDNTRFWAVSPDFIEQFACVIRSMGLEVR